MDLEGLKPIEVPVKFQGKRYLLKEASEGAQLEHRDGTLRAAKPNMETGKPTTMEGVGLVNAKFLASCLFEVTEGGQVPVTVEVVLAWPTKVVKMLRDKLREITGLREEEDEVSIDKQIEALKKNKADLAKLRESAKNGRGAMTSASV